MHSECQTTLLILNPTITEFLNLTWILEPHSEFLNLTPNSKTSLRIQKHHSEFKKLTRNSKTSLQIQKSHSEFLNLTPHSKISLRIQKHDSELKKNSLRIQKAWQIFEPHTYTEASQWFSSTSTQIGSQNLFHP